MKICILLATYNGEQFLKAQLNSILQQSKKSWECIIRDDGSIDDSVSIIKEYCKKDFRFTLLLDDKEPQGNAKDNFALLMEAGLNTDADCFFFCDQDDVWMTNKIELMDLEFKKHDTRQPLLIHHDLEVVNQDLIQLSPSFIQFRCIDINADFSKLLGRNRVTGCASACTRKLIEISLPIPSEAIMHDHWLGLVASYVGELYFLDKSLIKYRQHDNNVIGAKPFKVNLSLITSKERLIKRLLPFHKTILQSQALLHSINRNEYLKSVNKATLQAYAQIPSMTKIQKTRAILRFGFFQKNWLTKATTFIKFFMYSSKYYND